VSATEKIFAKIVLVGTIKKIHHTEIRENATNSLIICKYASGMYEYLLQLLPLEYWMLPLASEDIQILLLPLSL